MQYASSQITKIEHHLSRKYEFCENGLSGFENMDREIRN